MDSSSGKNPDENHTNKEPPGDVPRPREESKAATAAAAAAAEPPPPAPPSERLQERINGSPEAGEGRNPSAAAVVAAAEAAAAAQRDGTGIAAPSPRGSAVGKPPLPPRSASASRAGEQKPAGGKPRLPRRAVPASTSKSKGKKPMSHAEVVESGMAVRANWREMREGRREMEEAFHGLSEESKKAIPEQGTATQQKEQVKSVTIWPKNYYKGSLWRKFLDRVGISDLNSRIKNPAVNYERIPIACIAWHYELLEMVAGRGMEFNANALNLGRVYSEFRPVLGDGECFYRSFIFNYLEQVLDRQDTHEEHRLLVAAKEVARQHARLGWADEFSRSRKAFKKLIKKVMRWKRHRRWKHVPTANSYRKRKLLQYFNSYYGRNDIYAFLRFVAAIWICSHSEEFVPLILPELEERGYYTLTDWCLVEVIQQRVMTDHVQITALVRALGVPLRVENLLRGFGEDLHTVQGLQDNMPRSTCWSRHHQEVPPDHEVPRVILLYTNEHYDIIYPGPDAAVSQGSDKVESPPAKSQSQDRGSNDRGDLSSTSEKRTVNWLSLPPGVVWQISKSLHDDSDRLKMRLVAKEWHKELPAVAQRPWVIGSSMTGGMFHSIHGKNLCQLKFKCKIPNGFFYSSSGSFLLMQTGSRHSLWRPTNGVSLKLPLETYQKIVMTNASSPFAFALCDGKVPLSYGRPSDDASWKQIFCYDKAIKDVCQCDSKFYAVSNMFRLYRLDAEKSMLEPIRPQQASDDIRELLTVPKFPDHIFIAVGRDLGSVDLFKVVWVGDGMTSLVMVPDFGTSSLFLGRNQAIALNPDSFPGIESSSLYLALKPITDDAEATVVVYNLQTRRAVDTGYHLHNLGDPFFYHPDVVTATALFE